MKNKPKKQPIGTGEGLRVLRRIKPMVDFVDREISHNAWLEFLRRKDEKSDHLSQ
jgi:hypothetical protein